MTTTTRATRRRQRQPDSLAHPAAVKRLVLELRERVPNDLPKSEQAVEQMLIAIRHQETYGGSTSRRGRPSRYDREQMRRVADALKALLQRETQGRISLRTFVDHYLRVLHFPADLVAALANHSINLFEAEQLARLTAQTLKYSPAKADRLRVEMLKTHLASQESGARLRLRINQLLGELLGKSAAAAAANESEPINSEVAIAAAALEAELAGEFVELDPTHLFYDQLQHIGMMMRELSADDLSNESLEEILDLSDQLINALAKARKRPKKQNKLGV